MKDAKVIALAQQRYGRNEHPSIHRMISELRIGYRQCERVIAALEGEPSAAALPDRKLIQLPLPSPVGTTTTHL